MDFQSLSKNYLRDTDLPYRAWRIDALNRVLNNTQYDVLHYPFSEEFDAGGTYVPLWERRPSVRTGLCRVVVEDSISLLFSEGHWPTIQAKSPETVQQMGMLVKQTRLNETMLDAATKGSVGSVAILMRILSGKPFFDALTTTYLTPEWSPDDPDILVKVTERYKVKGRDLRSQGYPVDDDDLNSDFWFQRFWDDQAEAWFTPQKTTVKTAMALDIERSVVHGLGFVPIEWVRNLPGGDAVDGGCTFEAAISTVIEADYLLSQAGRGLNYSSDPKTVLSIQKGDNPDLSGGSANALVLPAGSDAKLLEINGTAAKAVLEHVRELRAYALESAHGNRSNADKLSAATSGRSIEMMMTGLLWLADRLRLSYGEGALLGLLKMACKASKVVAGGLSIGGTEVQIDDAGLELRWPPWIAPTAQDELVTAQAIVTAYAGGVISLKTSVTRMASVLGVDDVTAELALIEKAEAVKAQQAADALAMQARTAAAQGRTETRQETA